MSWSFIFLQFYHVLPVVKPSPCNTKHRKLRWIQHSFGSIPVAGEPQNVHPIPCRNRGWSERSPLARDFVMRLLRLIGKVFFSMGSQRGTMPPPQKMLKKGSRCWQLKHFLCSPRTLGETIPNLTSMFFKWVVQPPSRKIWKKDGLFLQKRGMHKKYCFVFVCCFLPKWLPV